MKKLLFILCALVLCAGCVRYEFLEPVPGKPGHVYVGETGSNLIFSRGAVKMYQVMPDGRLKFIGKVLPGALVDRPKEEPEPSSEEEETPPKNQWE